MTFEVFEKIISLLKEHEEKSLALYKLGIDLANTNDSLQEVISHLIASIYGLEGKDTFDWWCYEKDWGTREDLTMTNHKGEELCKTIHDLWEYLEQESLSKEEYNLPKKLTEEERLQMFKNIFS